MAGRWRMKNGLTTMIGVFAAGGLAVSGAHAQNPAKEGTSPSAPVAQTIRISSCTVRPANTALQVFDCTREAAKICNGNAECELNIGLNMTDGKDIDPAGGYLGKSVIVKYDCGDNMSRQRGPYHQSNHASVILECYIG